MEILSPSLQVDRDLMVNFIANLNGDKKIARNSSEAYRRDLVAFGLWLSEKNSNFLSIDSSDINQYLLFRMSNGYKTSSNARLFSSIKRFYGYLLAIGEITSDPCFGLRQPKVSLVPVKVLTDLQLELLMAAPNVSETLGLRDRAMLELLYSTGVKVSELIDLRLADVNLKAASISIARGSFPARSVYLTALCCDWLKEYQNIARGAFIKGSDSGWLFLSQRGLKMTRQAFWYRIKRYAATAGLELMVSPQTLRRSFAVNLLRAGIEVPVVQQVLGHQKIASTNKYTDL